MRWEALFADLEGQLAAEDAQALADEVADRSRREVSRLRIADRARACIGAEITLGVGAAGSVSGRVARVGPDWWLLAAAATELLVPVAATTWIRGLPAAAAEPATLTVVQARLGLGYVLRGIARDRVSLVLLLTDGSSLIGTVDRVGGDFVDVAEHPAGESRRAATVHSVRTVPTHALAVLRRAADLA